MPVGMNRQRTITALREVSGGLGDLGAFLPLTLALAAAGAISFPAAVAFAGVARAVGGQGLVVFLTQVNLLERPHGAWIEPLGGREAPAACMELSMRVRAVTHLRNDLTGEAVDRIELDAPGTPLEVFLSPWQLERDQLPPPRPGSRLEGVFLLLGRVVGGLPRRRRSGVAFG